MDCWQLSGNERGKILLGRVIKVVAHAQRPKMLKQERGQEEHGAVMTGLQKESVALQKDTDTDTEAAPVLGAGLITRRENVYPGCFTAVVRCCSEDGKKGPVDKSCRAMRWGLATGNSRQGAAGEIPSPFLPGAMNVRSETALSLGMFARLMCSKRAIAVVSGFYEWSGSKGSKQPHYCYIDESEPMLLAVIYDTWLDASDDEVYTYSILTTESNKSFSWLHHRQPVFLDRDNAFAWLDTANVSADQALKIALQSSRERRSKLGL